MSSYRKQREPQAEVALAAALSYTGDYEEAHAHLRNLDVKALTQLMLAADWMFKHANILLKDRGVQDIGRVAAGILREMEAAPRA